MPASAPMSVDRPHSAQIHGTTDYSTARVVTVTPNREHNLADRPGSIVNIWISFDPHLVIMNLLFPGGVKRLDKSYKSRGW